MLRQSYIPVLGLFCQLILGAEHPTIAQDTIKPSVFRKTAPEDSQLRTFRWQVVEYGTEKPISNATVQLTHRFVNDVDVLAMHDIATEQFTTDADGCYSFSLDLSQDLANQWLMIAVSHPSYLPTPNGGQRRSVSLNRQLKNYQVDKPIGVETQQLHPAREVHGVLHTPDGKPAAGVEIQGYSYLDEETAMKVAQRDQNQSEIKSKTDSEGRFRLLAAASGGGRYWFLPKDFAPKGVDASQQVTDLGIVVLENGLRSKGRLIDAEGRPVGNMTVMANRMKREFPTLSGVNRYRRSATTDAEGFFELDPVAPGSYDFRIGYRATSEHKKPDFAGEFLPVERIISSDEVLEFRAVPTVEIRLATLNSKREPAEPLRFNVLGYFEGALVRVGGTSLRPTKGKSLQRIPKGTTKVRLNLPELPNEAILLRREAGALYELNPRGVIYDVIDRDLDIEVIQFQPTRLKIKTIDASGKEYPDVRPQGTITSTELEDGEVDIEFYKRDGIWRSQPLITIGQLTVTAEDPVAGQAAKTIEVIEGQEQDVTLVLSRK